MTRTHPRFTPGRSKLARLALAGAVLFGAAPVAVAETTLPPVTLTTATPVDGTWKLTVVADSLARANGRDDCFEYLTIDGFGFTGQEISRLGFNSGAPTTGMNAAGELTFTLTMSSGSHGSWTATGRFALDNNSMSGNLSWLKDGQTHKYTFTGVRYTPTAVED